MSGARYVVVGLLGVVAVAALLRGPAAKPVVAMQTAAPAPSPRHHLQPSSQGLVIYVAGAVARPGLYTLADGSRAIDAVAKAGGLRADADPAGVDLAEPLVDGEEIAAPVAGGRRASSAHGIRKPKRAPRQHKKQVSALMLDLNSADAGALAQLPGVGQEIARRVVAFREANGDFASLDELADVAGMTQSRIAAVTPYLFVNSK